MLPEVSEKTKKRMVEIAKELQNKRNLTKKVDDPKEKKIKKKGTRGESSV